MDLLKKLSMLEQSAEQFGFKWDNPVQILEQIKSECIEVEEHLHDKNASAKLEEEIGDLLHAAFSLCVFCKFDPEQTLEKSISKFERRLTAVKTIAKDQGHHSLNGFPFDELMKIWQQAKSREGSIK